MVDSETDGIPAMPSRAETSPSCMTPSSESDGSSSCRAMVPPASRWYCRARRSIPAETTGLPSSVNPGAPVGDEPRAELDHVSAAYEHVEAGVDAGPRVEHVGAADEQLGRRGGAGEEPAHASAPAVAGSRAGAAASSS